MNNFNLQSLRSKEGLSQQELARKLGISNSSLSQAEHGNRSISLDKYISALDFLGYELMFAKKDLEDITHYKPINNLDLRELRAEIELKQDYLAKKAGISSSYLSRLEKKLNKNLSIYKYMTLLDILGYRLIPLKKNFQKTDIGATSMIEEKTLTELKKKEENEQILKAKKYKEYMDSKKELMFEIKNQLDSNALSTILSILNSIEEDLDKEIPLFSINYNKDFLGNLKFLIDNDIEYTKKLDAEFYFILDRYKVLSASENKNVKAIANSLQAKAIDGKIYEESLEESIKRLGKPEYNSWSGAGCLEYRYLKDGTKVGVVHYLYSYYTTITRLNNITEEEFEESGYFNNEEYIILGEKEEPDDKTLGRCEDLYDLFETDVLQELLDTSIKVYHEGHLLDSRLWTYNNIFDYLITLIKNNAL